MNIRLSVIASTWIATAMLSGTALEQPKASGHINFNSCSEARRSGRRIVSNLEIVEFHIPRFAKMKRIADADYVEYYVRYGPEPGKLWLKFMFGPLIGGQQPHDLLDPSIKWTAQKWGCQQSEEGTDWIGVGTDGRKWRHLAIPFGFAAYESVPPKASHYFDKILDTMCCGK